MYDARGRGLRHRAWVLVLVLAACTSPGPPPEDASDRPPAPCVPGTPKCGPPDAGPPRGDEGQGCVPKARPNLGGQWSHPNALVGPNELALMRVRVRRGLEPWRRAAEALARDTPLDYRPHPRAEVNITWNGYDPDGTQTTHRELVELDGEQAYQQALMFAVSGDRRYAENAIAILEGWADTCRLFIGNNAPLEAAWATASMTRAAELLKHTDSGWTPEIERKFLRFLDAHMIPAMRRLVNGWPDGAFNNWQGSIIEAMMQVASFRQDAATFNEMVEIYRRNLLPRYTYPSGELTETCRDLFHSQFGIGSLAQIAELAWQQGIDLYAEQSERLAQVLEYHADILTRGVEDVRRNPPPGLHCDVGEIKGLNFQPVWEIALNHYEGRLGRSLPKSRSWVEKNKRTDDTDPSNDTGEGYTFHWGLGTLTHFESACR